ncbi:hypothetical protein [Streptomyces lydicus]|uniref:hypothetical protein n=1 Tax=Streptomyces lydicus TaxID=47763 RepID=UPI00378AFA77
MVAASVHDHAVGIAPLDKVAVTAPAVTKSGVDAGFKQALVEHGARLGIDVEIVQREPGTRGATPEPQEMGGGANGAPDRRAAGRLRLLGAAESVRRLTSCALCACGLGCAAGYVVDACPSRSVP